MRGLHKSSGHGNETDGEHDFTMDDWKPLDQALCQFQLKCVYVSVVDANYTRIGADVLRSLLPKLASHARADFVYGSLVWQDW